ncbi:uncharacterized protein [Montipora capricornis]|uniref:uncharacterized protein n=1 Tax=Montipora capricornis TaxID=246305 RepID=UPI0035F1709C
METEDRLESEDKGVTNCEWRFVILRDPENKCACNGSHSYEGPIVEENQANGIDLMRVCETPGLSCWWTVVKHLCWSLLGMSELDPLDSVDHTSETIAGFLFGLFLVLGVILLINMMIALLSNTYQTVQDNSLREWSFKKAVTIQTYSNYHPVPVPFNIFWCLWLLCRKCYQRCMGCRERQGDANDGKGNSSEGKRKSLEFVLRNLQMRYFGTYGESFPVTDDAKIDQIFHETRQNQQMTNQLAYGTFMTSALDESALPVGQEAWDASGITVDGCRLSYEGERTCETCKRNVPVIYHGARYRIPFSREFSHFKVRVQGNERFMGVGVVWKDYGKHDMPGWREDTVGYIVNQGKVFGPCYPANPKTGREYENAVAYRGDEVGCSVDFGSAENPEEVEIVFTLNGKQITQDKIRMPYDVQYCGSFSMKIYPYVCLTTPGMTVLAKMSSSKSASPRLVSEDIMAITQATSHITEIVSTKFEEAKTVIDGFEMRLDSS